MLGLMSWSGLSLTPSPGRCPVPRAGAVPALLPVLLPPRDLRHHTQPRAECAISAKSVFCLHLITEFSFSTSSQIKTQENSIRSNAGFRQIFGQRLLCSASPPPTMVSQGMTIPGVASQLLEAISFEIYG